MTEGARRSRAYRTITVVLVLLPIALGMPGIGMHFVPAPSRRWMAILAAIAYGVVISILVVKNGRAPTPEKNEIVPTPIKVMFGIVFATYCCYVSLLMTIPALFTQAYGSSADKEYVIEELKIGGSKAVLCPYRLRLRDVVTVLNDCYCVSGSFVRQHSAGQSIRLSGKESSFGFRFLNAG